MMKHADYFIFTAKSEYAAFLSNICLVVALVTSLSDCRLLLVQLNQHGGTGKKDATEGKIWL
jgi:hypothetical protein